jgi:excisionase family DNA binding protein
MGESHSTNQSPALKAQEGRWLTINEACSLLGVDQTTLRRWSDAGKIPVFRTMGGHRRYAEADVQELVRKGMHQPATRGVYAPHPIHPPSPYEAEYLQGARDRQWFSAFDAASLEQLRLSGRDLVKLALHYAELEPGDQDRAALITEGQRIGVIYGHHAHTAGLTVAETVEAFLYFRFPVVLAAGGMVDNESISPEEVRKIYSDVNQFTDRVLLATVRAREDAAHRAQSADRHD